MEDWEQEPWKLRLFEVRPDQSSVALDTGQALSGENCLRLRYVFDNRGGDGKKMSAEAVVLTREFAQPLDLSPGRGFTVCVRGGAPALRLWAEDADGDALVFPLARFSAREWTRLYVAFDDPGARLRPWGNGRWDGWGKVASLSFEVTDAAKTDFRTAPEGETLYLDALAVVEK